jgi:heme/copper-type cytochrome/quinol oxidase subunit 3
VTELTAESTPYGVVEEEPPEILGRNLSSAGHLLASATAFFFLAFVFAYFYLRSLDNSHKWRPKHVDPSVGLGTAVVVLIVLSAIALRLGLADQRAARRPEWRLKAVVSLVLGLAAIVVQIVQWATIGFGPNSGGYASVFFGWTAFLALFVFGSLYWTETLLATAYRYRNVPVGALPAAGEASGDPYRPQPDVADPLSLVRPGLEAASFYWTFMAGLAVVTWIVLYLI